MASTARIAATAGLAAGTAGAAALSYHLLFRRRCLTWGARPAEVTGHLPGDDLLARADIVSTRVVTIAALPEAIWPWLVQLGSGRGGAYTYDWIENLLGLDMHSAEEILPQFQDLEVGDEFQLGRGRPAMRVAVLQPAKVLAFRLEDGNWVWIFALLPDGGSTRLVSRNRIAMPHASASARLFSELLMEPGSLIMERKMLLGIRQRAERTARQQP